MPTKAEQRLGFRAVAFPVALLLAALFVLCAGAARSQEQLVISEFMAANSRTLNDEDGDSSDWLEIYNPSTNAVSLLDWSLTDDATNLVKWRFPNFTMASASYLVVFASDKNRTNLTGRLHTNFKLSTGGEYLALVDANTNVISEFAPAFPAQQTDVSYGRDPLEPTQAGYFSVPTPGARNASGGPGFASAVLFGQASSTFTSPFELTLSLAAPAADTIIRFTLNGTLPTNGSPAYASPIPITNSVQVRARAFRPGYLPGPPHSELFFLLNTNVQAVTSDLPLLLLHTMGGGLASPALDKFVAVAVFEPKVGVSSFLNPPDLVTRARFKIRGSSTEGEPKSSWAVELWDEFNGDRDEPLLGMPADSDWVFYGPNHFEPLLIHNPFAHALSRQIGRYSPRTEFAEVYQNSGGGAVVAANYNGIYAIEEKIKVGRDRVDIDKLEPEHTTPPLVTGGYLLKIDRADPGDSGFVGAGQGLLYVEPKESELELPQRDAQEQYIRGYFNSFGAALTGPNFKDPTVGYNAYVDASSWIDHHLLNVLTFNVDAFRLSGYFYKPRGGRITMGPLWDFDRALASTDGRDTNPRVWRSQTGDFGTDFWNYPWWGRMFTDTNFFQMWIDRYQELRQGAFSQENLNTLVDTLANQVRAAQPRDAARFGVRPRSTGTSYPWMSALNGTYDGEIAALKVWLQDRLDFMDTNFVAPPRLSRPAGPVTPGEEVALVVPPGAIAYYTTDGTDPRLSTAPSQYTAPLVLERNARVVARTYNSTHRNLTGINNPPISSPWSGPVAATYVVTRIPLIVTELMYHPAPAPRGSAYDEDDFEFIELKNIGSTPLPLAGCRFTNGILFAFAPQSPVILAPDERIVLVRNTAAFVSRYGSGVRVGGEFAGNLDNNGERLYLEGPLQEPILDFRYSDQWYPITDGFGFSLVLVNEQAPPSAWNERTNWRPSRDQQGAPGSVDPPPLEHPRVLINEVLTNPTLPNPDRIELWNASSVAADLSGWLLTDERNVPQKYQFPAGTLLEPGAYLVLDESAFNPVGSPRAFGLSSRGEEIWLFSATASGDLTGYLHGFDFGPAALDATFGRYVNSQGTEQWPAQRATTWNGANSGPSVGPIVISELHYHPVDRRAFTLTVDNTLDEFLELRNISDQPVPLFDPAFPTNRWRLTDAVEFVFPPGAEMPSRGVALVVSFDPTNVVQRARFQAAFAVSELVPLYGPYRGRLDNSSERVELRKPTPPALDTGVVDGIVVDRVQYQDKPPWPSGADGLGLSLQRLVEGDYGNDPTNWVAAMPSPGDAYRGGLAPTIVTSPANLTAVAYTDVTMHVQASGPEPLRYQWLLNDEAVLGATNATLLLTNLQPNQAGQFVAAVFNQAGLVFSQPAILSIRIPATIFRQPENVSIRRGSNFVLFVQATGTGLLSYQWYFNGQPLLSATNSILSFTNVQLASAGSYYVVVRDEIGATPSRVVNVLVQVAPFIVEQPGPPYLNVVEGEVLRLTGTVGPIHPTLPLSIRWRRNGLFLPEQTNAVLTFVLTNIVPTNALTASNGFSFVLSNPILPPVISSNVAVFVHADRDADGMGDAWELAFGLDPARPADALADADGDGLSNLEEFRAGTDPTNGSSGLNLSLDLAPGENAALSFGAASNKTYSVLWREALTRGQWTTLTNLTWRRTNWQAVFRDPYPPAAGRIYRVVTPRTGQVPSPGPILLATPESLVVHAGEPGEFRVETIGDGPVQYQWSFEGNELPGQTGPVLRFEPALTNHHGQYRVRVADAQAAVVVGPVQLTVLVPPVIEQQPGDLLVAAGGAAAFTIQATGVEPLQYQWLHNSRFIRGATNASLSLGNVRPEAAGTYSVLIWHTPPTGRAYIWSAPARLEVSP